MCVGLFEGGGVMEGFDMGVEVVEFGVDEDVMVMEENKLWYNFCFCVCWRE